MSTVQFFTMTKIKANKLVVTSPYCARIHDIFNHIYIILNAYHQVQTISPACREENMLGEKTIWHYIKEIPPVWST